MREVLPFCDGLLSARRYVWLRCVGRGFEGVIKQAHLVRGSDDSGAVVHKVEKDTRVTCDCNNGHTATVESQHQGLFFLSFRPYFLESSFDKSLSGA